MGSKLDEVFDVGLSVSDMEFIESIELPTAILGQLSHREVPEELSTLWTAAQILFGLGIYPDPAVNCATARWAIQEVRGLLELAEEEVRDNDGC